MEANRLTIICVAKKSERDIAGLLEEHGESHGAHYYFYEEYMDRILPILAAYHFQEAFMDFSQIVLTSRCTLRCEKCAHGCQVKRFREDMPLDEAYKTLTIYFDKMDYVNEFVLIGGEPLLYDRISDIIQFIGTHYSEKFGILSITTNGTIIPDESVLEVIRRYGVSIHISDYSNASEFVNEKQRILLDKLDSLSIRHTMTKEQKWVDFGFDYVWKDCPDSEMVGFFDKCLTPCREIKGNRLYFCVTSHVSGENYGFGPSLDDSLDLEGPLLLGEDYRKILLEYNLGYNPKGYLDMCRRCNGSAHMNPYSVPVAKQLK